MPWPDLNPVEPPPAMPIPWTTWAAGGVLLCVLVVVAVLALRRTLRKKPVLLPPPDPRQRALQALAAIPDDWPTARCAAAGARILRGYFAVLALGPGTAHPAKDFSGLRAAEPMRDLTDTLAALESLACRPHPARADWLAARDAAVTSLQSPVVPADLP